MLMNLNVRLAVLAFAAGALAVPALAQPGGKPPTPEERAAFFDKADVNKDGKLSLAEFKTTPLAQRAANATDDQHAQFFASRDTDRDGSLSKAELTAPMNQEHPQ